MNVVATTVAVVILLLRWQLAASSVRRGTVSALDDRESAELYGLTVIVGGVAGTSVLLAAVLGVGTTGRWCVGLVAVVVVVGFVVTGWLGARFPGLVLSTSQNATSRDQNIFWSRLVAATSGLAVRGA